MKTIKKTSFYWFKIADKPTPAYEGNVEEMLLNWRFNMAIDASNLTELLTVKWARLAAMEKGEI